MCNQLTDGNDMEAIAAAIENAKKETDKPSLIKVRTHIAYGAPIKWILLMRMAHPWQR